VEQDRVLARMVAGEAQVGDAAGAHRGARVAGMLGLGSVERRAERGEAAAL